MNEISTFFLVKIDDFRLWFFCHSYSLIYALCITLKGKEQYLTVLIKRTLMFPSFILRSRCKGYRWKLDMSLEIAYTVPLIDSIIKFGLFWLKTWFSLFSENRKSWEQLFFKKNVWRSCCPGWQTTRYFKFKVLGRIFKI